MQTRFAALLVVLLAIAARGAASAQSTETPVAFDQAGRMRSMTQPFVDRLALKAPEWPVQGEFVNARLYSASTGGFVLAVEHKDGRIDRFVLSDAQADALRAAVAQSTARVGNVVTEESTNDISQPARGPFVRNQMILSALMYAPAASALTHDATAGTALYLLSIGGSYFVVSALSKERTITKAENQLATDGALRLPGVLFAGYYAGGASPSSDLVSATFLIGGIGGSALGFQFGRGLTTSEASAMTFTSTLSALTAIGVGGATGLSDHNGRLTAALALGAGVGGYALGPRYPRNAHYAVTAGDISMLGLSGALGIMTAGIPIIGRNDHLSVEVGSAVLTAGMLGGVLVGDRVFVRRYDHTESEATLVSLGALAGGIMGAAIPVLARNDDPTLTLSSVTVGAILGTIASENIVAPRAGIIRLSDARSRKPARFSFDPGSLALAAAGMPGRYSIARLEF